MCFASSREGFFLSGELNRCRITSTRSGHIGISWTIRLREDQTFRHRHNTSGPNYWKSTIGRGSRVVSSPIMNRSKVSRRSFLKTTSALATMSPIASAVAERHGQTARALVAYVGTFSSPLRDTLPTQVDLPPGNGRGIHAFRVDRTTGAMTPSAIIEMGTSPNCLALNAASTRLYSSNETDRLGEDKQGSASAFAIDRTTGALQLLNTVGTGAPGPTYVSVHPGGRHLLVANYFGGSVAVLPIQSDGRLGDASDLRRDAGTVGAIRAADAPPGSFAVSGHDRTHAHMIQADRSGRFVLHADLG